MSLTSDTKWNKTTSAPSKSTGKKSLFRKISLIKWYMIPVCKKRKQNNHLPKKTNGTANSPRSNK